MDECILDVSDDVLVAVSYPEHVEGEAYETPTINQIFQIIKSGYLDAHDKLYDVNNECIITGISITYDDVYHFPVSVGYRYSYPPGVAFETLKSRSITDFRVK